MRITIEDLEALKELNDELEENHVEAEKQLNTEIGESGPCYRREDSILSVYRQNHSSAQGGTSTVYRARRHHL